MKVSLQSFGVKPENYQERVTGLYDWLSRFNLLANLVMFGRTTADLTMHKTLRIPSEHAEVYPNAEKRLYITDRALEAAGLPSAPQVLDAGCGFGGTIFRWRDRAAGTYDGLTLSRVQWKVARREARRRSVQDSCRFHLRSYDEPIGQTYDAVVSIEALVHSSSLEHTLGNLASALKPRGKLVIVEDIPLDEAQGDCDLAQLRRHWELSEVPSMSRYRAVLAANRLRVLHDVDYSDGFLIMPPEKLASLETRYRTLSKVVPLAGPRFVASAFLGGLALERLYRKRLVQYRLIVAQAM